MIELYELRQFAAFAEAGTLSGAAELLHLSQPALSRNMKTLEDELGITLFERKKNKLELNENGKYVMELTRKLLEDADSFAAKARDFDRRNRTITLGVCAPAPVWRLAPLISNVFPSMALQTEMDDDCRLPPCPLLPPILRKSIRKCPITGSISPFPMMRRQLPITLYVNPRKRNLFPCCLPPCSGSSYECNK